MLMTKIATLGQTNLNIVHGRCTVQGVKGVACVDKQGSLNVLLLETLKALLRHLLTFIITGRTTFWSNSHQDFFLPELSAILL